MQEEMIYHAQTHNNKVGKNKQADMNCYLLDIEILSASIIKCRFTFSKLIINKVVHFIITN